jgi:hypothetical protein
MSTKQRGLRANLNKALNEPADRLPQELRIDPIDLTSRGGPVKYLSLRDLQLTGGWATANWRAE